MKKLVFLFFGVIAALVSEQVWAWSAEGHGDIAVAAFERLPEPLQEDYRQLLLYGPWAKKNISWRTAVARAAAWPDRVKDLPLRKLFGRYGSGKVPAALVAHRKNTTQDWHYTNALFISADGRVLDASVDARSCPPRADGLLLDIWPKLLLAYQQTTDRKDKALILTFVLHMAGDAYQPLHLMASLNNECKHDRGGNGFCVQPPTGFAQQRCGDSLHYLWDQGFDAFDAELKARGFRGDARDLTRAISHVRQLAPQVYPRHPSHATQKDYQKQSRTAVTQLSAVAADHLAATLRLLAAP